MPACCHECFLVSFVAFAYHIITQLPTNLLLALTLPFTIPTCILGVRLLFTILSNEKSGFRGIATFLVCICLR